MMQCHRIPGYLICLTYEGFPEVPLNSYVDFNGSMQPTYSRLRSLNLKRVI